MKRHLFVLLVVLSMELIITPGAQGKLTSAQLYDLAGQANTFFHQANAQVQDDPAQAKELYEQAILRYRKIIDEGQIANGYLYYNIANAYLLKGDVGRAILHYRRAEKLGMVGQELAKNLAFARSKRLDQVPIRTEKRVMQTLFFWHYDLTVRSRFLLAGGLWALALLAGSLRLWWRRRWLASLLLVCLVPAVCLAGSVVVEAIQAQHHVQGVIVAEALIARQGDGENYAPSFTEPLHSGTEFDLLEKRPHWLRIELANGAVAWIPQAGAETI